MPTDKTPVNANIDALYDCTVVDQSGDKIGEIGQVYLDDASGQPAWVTVKTGVFGRNEIFVPFRGLQTSGDQIRTPYTKDKVKDAPNVDPDGHLSEDETDELYRYYSDAFTAHNDPASDVADNGVAGGVVGQTTGETKSADETTDARANRGADGDGVSGDQIAGVKPQRVADTEPQTTQKSPVAEDGSVVRHEERPTVDKETVAAEKITIGKETTQDTQTVSGKVAKEQIDIDQAKQPKNK